MEFKVVQKELELTPSLQSRSMQIELPAPSSSFSSSCSPFSQKIPYVQIFIPELPQTPDGYRFSYWLHPPVPPGRHR